MITSDNSSSTAGYIWSPPGYDHYPAEQLRGVHERIGNVSWLQRVKSGWSSLMDRSSRCAQVGYKALAGLGVTFTTLFGTASITFAGLAMKSALDEISDSGIGPTIGHLPEWAVQGLLVLTLPITFASEVAALGRREGASHAYLEAIESAGSADEQEWMYRDMGRALRDLPPPSYLDFPLFPRTPRVIHNLLTADSELYQDHYLDTAYEDIEQEIRGISNWQQFKMGCRVIAEEKGRWKSVAISVASVSAITFVTAALVHYGLGIVWAGEQAYNDYNAGDNPNIGGHSLEWTAEAVVVSRLLFNYFGEVISVGSAKLIVDKFREARAAATSDHELDRSTRKGRLTQVTQRVVGALPSGWFYNFPTRFLYEDEADMVVDV